MLLDLSQVVVLGLACWRITSLLVNEDGPLDIFPKFRRWIGVYYDEYSNPQGKNAIARGLTCVWCTSIWMAGILAIFALYSVNIRTWSALMSSYFVYVFAISSIAIIIDNFAGKR